MSRIPLAALLLLLTRHPPAVSSARASSSWSSSPSSPSSSSWGSSSRSSSPSSSWSSSSPSSFSRSSPSPSSWSSPSSSSRWGSSAPSGASSRWSSPPSPSSRISWSSPPSSSRPSPSPSSWSSPPSSPSNWGTSRPAGPTSSASRVPWSSPPTPSRYNPSPPSSSSKWGTSQPSGPPSRVSSPPSSSWTSRWLPSPPSSPPASPKSSWYRVPSPAPSSSKWGSSAPSGSRPASAYAAAGKAAVKSASNRPLVSPGKAAPVRVVPVITNPGVTVINNYRTPSSYVVTSDGGFYNGYLLGRMLSGSSRHYYYDYDYYNYYVPYRYNYRPYDTYDAYPPPSPVVVVNAPGTAVPLTTTSAPVAKSKSFCALARWNMELPFSELPNMALQFLSNDSVSGATSTDKAKFMFELLNGTLQSYGDLPVSADVFQLDSSLSVSQCGFRTPNPRARYAGAQRAAAPIQEKKAVICGFSQKDQNGVRSAFDVDCDRSNASNAPEVDEPFVISINNLLAKYASPAGDTSDLFSDVVSASKACLGDPQRLNNWPASLYPCLDFAVDAAQTTALHNEDSMFGNEELCRKHLNPDISQCLRGATTTSCGLNELTNLQVLARNFYLCAEPVGSNLLDYANNRPSALSAADAVPTEDSTTWRSAAVPLVPQVVDAAGDNSNRIYPYRSGSVRWPVTFNCILLSLWISVYSMPFLFRMPVG
ncbi:uncharacterized protein LOC129593995 [Paramacrobiotus metropolitanus]|uniref:uncharacterized protein LOC129593995 n=1 Tax=Paramacrobiotus metropolitanus TaxID=2943436 RepID=UPI0024458DD5|nr:uncharacterized protein LOC129593995 [Paramacrobiotus metropolitanus]